MPINDPYSKPINRQPRLKILYNSVEIPGAISATVTNNNYFASDTFRASFALNARTGDNINSAPQYGANWWGEAAKQQIILDIDFSLDAGQTWNTDLVRQVDQ